MSRSRDYRRHQENKWKKRVRSYYYLNYLKDVYWEKYSNKEIERRIGLASHTRKPCSCCVCGNPRKKYNWTYFSQGRTLKEYISDIEFYEQIKEFKDENIIDI